MATACERHTDTRVGWSTTLSSPPVLKDKGDQRQYVRKLRCPQWSWQHKSPQQQSATSVLGLSPSALALMEHVPNSSVWGGQGADRAGGYLDCLVERFWANGQDCWWVALPAGVGQLACHLLVMCKESTSRSSSYAHDLHRNIMIDMANCGRIICKMPMHQSSLRIIM